MEELEEFLPLDVVKIIEKYIDIVDIALENPTVSNFVDECFDEIEIPKCIDNEEFRSMITRDIVNDIIYHKEYLGEYRDSVYEYGSIQIKLPHIHIPSELFAVWYICKQQITSVLDILYGFAEFQDECIIIFDAIFERSDLKKKSRSIEQYTRFIFNCLEDHWINVIHDKIGYVYQGFMSDLSDRLGEIRLRFPTQKEFDEFVNHPNR